MSSDEVTLILAAINGVKTDIQLCESRLSGRMADISVVQEEHGERLTVIETRHRPGGGYDDDRAARRRTNVKRAVGVGGGLGALAFIPQIIHDIGALIKALTGKP